MTLSARKKKFANRSSPSEFGPKAAIGIVARNVMIFLDCPPQLKIA
jgi:hypothetical protein